jgi:lysophospholipase L1-like esterase
MFPNNQIRIAHWVWAGSVAAVFATVVAAHAEMPTPAHIVASALPAAAPASGSATDPAPPAAKDDVRPALAAPAAAGDLSAQQSQAICTAPTGLAGFAYPLLRTARRVASGQPLTIVAIGSSSTAGAGASSSAASYPSRLAVDLKKLFPTEAIAVLNRGVNGEETEDMMARFQTGVIAEHPQLVLWQVGTNSVLRDHPLASHAVQLHDGIDQLKATGADVVLLDLQYAPKVLAKAETQGMVDQIALTAKEQDVDLFQRFAVMRNWYEVQHLGFGVFVSPDGLHMNDWGYACVAKLLATQIAEAATRPVASAAARQAR